MKAVIIVWISSCSFFEFLCCEIGLMSVVIHPRSVRGDGSRNEVLIWRPDSSLFAKKISCAVSMASPSLVWST